MVQPARHRRGELTSDAFENGLTREQGAAAIDIGESAQWPEAEREEMNIATLYATFERARDGD